MELIQINSNAIEVTWPYVKDLVQKPLDKSLGERDLEDVYNSLIHDQIVLWVATDKEDGIMGIMITQIVHHPQYKLLLISLVSVSTKTPGCLYKGTLISMPLIKSSYISFFSTGDKYSKYKSIGSGF